MPDRLRRGFQVSAMLALVFASLSLSVNAGESSPFRQPVRLGFAAGDDWEPAVAVDGTHVYVFWMHIGANPPDCSLPANPHMVFQASADGGRTWSPPHSIVCQAEFQADAQLAVTVMPDGRHRVNASWMDSNQLNSPIWVAFSDDFAASWKGPSWRPGSTMAAAAGTRTSWWSMDRASGSPGST